MTITFDQTRDPRGGPQDFENLRHLRHASLGLVAGAQLAALCRGNLYPDGADIAPVKVVKTGCEDNLHIHGGGGPRGSFA